MRKLYIVALAIAGLLLMPLAGYAQSEQKTSTGPPVAQPLVREGEFAVELVQALKIGTAQNEADAETMLTSSGIAPKNGWIADYPVTPDIVGELQKAVVAAAGSQKLPMGRDEALNSLQRVTEQLGLPVVADTSVQPAQSGPPPTTYSEENPNVVNNYYYDYGPPVVTYYPPPPDYYYLYAWVPYPFWSSGFFFTGFFCLHDFHRIIVVNNVTKIITNHTSIPGRGGLPYAIDPPSRATGRGLRTENISHPGEFNSAEARKGAQAIFNRSVERARIGNAEHALISNGFTSTHPSTSRSGEHFQSQVPSNRGSSLQGMGRGNEGDNFTRRGGSEFSGPSPSSGRSSSAPPVHGRGPSMQFNSGGFSQGGSSGVFHGGGSGHSGSSAGFHGGGGRASCTGRC
jgi:hypothetical protein